MAESSYLREWPQTRVEWRINNFWDLSKKDDFCLNSPPFYLSDTTWHISMYPNGQTTANSVGWIGLYLSKGKNTHNEYYVDFIIGIRNYDGTVLAQTLKEVHKFKICGPGRGRSSLIQISALKASNAVSPDGTLTIFCSAAKVEEACLPTAKSVASWTPSPPIIESLEAASQTLYSDGIQTLIENFKSLYLSKRFADVTITVDGREFFAHKSVLTSRSTVFFTMFTSDMAEKNSGKVEITDCDGDTFEEFLLFLYTGKLDMVTPSNAPRLYDIADKYDVQELKAECIRSMTNELTIDSFCDIVRLATIHDETEIMQAATHFFIENAENILVTLKWQNFSLENPSVGNELVLKFVRKHKSGQ